MATVPTPYDATTGLKLSATAWDLGVRDPLNFLLDSPHCSVYMAGNQAIPNGTQTLLLFDTETDDTDTMHSTASNTGRIVFTTAGRYHIIINVALPSAAYVGLDIHLRLNAAGSSGGGTLIRTWTVVAGAGGGSGASRSNVIPLTRVFAAADYVEVFVAQNSGGGASTVTGGNQYATGVQARWIGIT